MKTRSQTIKCADVERAETLSDAKGTYERLESVDDKQRIMELIVTEINHSLTPSTVVSGVPSLTGAFGFGSLQTPTEIPSFQIYEVNIDFDDASAAWRMNKKSTGGGCYKYICEAKTQLGNNCLREPIIGCAYCKTHNKSNPSTSIYGSLQKK